MTCLSGYLVTLTIQRIDAPILKVKYLLGIGLICVLVALLAALLDPINKSLWTSSYVLISSGIACIILASIVICWDIYHLKFGLNALKIYGSNPILLFVLAGLVARALVMITVDVDGKSLAIKQAVFNALAHIMPEKMASLSFAVIFTLTFYLLALWLYRRSIFIKL